MSTGDVKTMSVLKLNMLMQRFNEPLYKKAIDRKLQESK